MAKSKKFWKSLIGLIVGGGLVIAGAVTGKIPVEQVIQYFLGQSDTIVDVIEEGTRNPPATGTLDLYPQPSPVPFPEPEAAPGERADLIEWRTTG